MRKKFFSFLALMLVLLVGLNQPAYAAEPVLNQALDNPIVGDETAFVGVIDLKTGVTHIDTIDVEVGKYYVVNISVTNDMLGTVAEGTRIKTSFPDQMRANDVATLWAEVSADNTADGEPIGRGVTLRTERPVRLQLVDGYAELCGSGAINALEVSEAELRDEAGILVGQDEQDGSLPGGYRHTVQLIYYLYAAPVATETPTKTKPKSINAKTALA